jgi:probable rRNA maturation factor
MPITVAGPRGTGRLCAPLATLVRAALTLEHRRLGDVAITITDDARLRELNHAWRGIDRATDVLSFHYHEPGEPVSGDLVISAERWHEQARRYRITPGRELARLVVHGVLHLAGLDHHRAAERRRMRAQELRAMRVAAAAIRRLETLTG